MFILPALGVLALAWIPAPSQDDGPSPEEVAVEAARSAFTKAGPKEREERLLDLEELLSGEDLKLVLEGRVERLVAGIAKDSTLRKLEKLSETKAELDDLRTRTLTLIRDESKYINPYRVPDVSSEAASGYIKVQREIDELVKDAEKLYGGKKKVKLSKGFAALVEDLQWTVSCRPKVLEMEAPPGELPPWVLSLDPDVGRDPITIRTFAANPSEAERLRLDRLVMTHNEHRMAWALKAKKDLPETQRPNSAEINQVLFTNEYRLVLGLRALAWNPLLQEATDHHSAYQSKWGILTHHQEKNPESRDFGMRCRNAGYERPRGENCSKGSPDPKQTHVAWRHSSGHHRNLVSSGHTEMASAVAGSYWTQNFGGAKLDEAVLGEWQEKRR